MLLFSKASDTEAGPQMASEARSGPDAILSDQAIGLGKAEARKRLLARRKALSPAESLRLSEQIQSIVLNSPQWQKARSLALYVAARQEVDTAKLLDAAWAEGKSLLLPRCLPKDPDEAPDAGGRMVFAFCRSRADLAPGVFGLQEPLASCPFLFPLAPQEGEVLPDLAIVPLLGLRPDGARLGYGGGYYDRAFSSPPWNAVPRLALAYSFQITTFPVQQQKEARGRDVFMHGYATEEGLLWL